MSKHAHVIAVYSLKGGVGKTSLAVNLAAEAARPVLPMASIVEQMAARRAPLSSYGRSTKAGKAYSTLWQRVAALLAAR